MLRLQLRVRFGRVVADAKRTVKFVQRWDTEAAVECAAQRDGIESPIVTIARETLTKFRAPVWGGQITNRADLLMALSHGEGAREYYAEGRAAAEIARLWAAIERSVKAIRGSASASGAMHKQAA